MTINKYKINNLQLWQNNCHGSGQGRGSPSR